jgi:Cyclopropane fatty acid synthase and related methyltransferases
MPTDMQQAGAPVLFTSTEGQNDLPRYFPQVFAMARDMAAGRLDFVLPDGRVFRAEGRAPGPVAELRIHTDDVFARLIREGDLGFCEDYLDGGWSTPDLQAFMDLLHAGNDDLYDGFPGMGLLRAFERLRHWMNANTRRQAKKNISYHYDLGNEFYRLWLDDTMTYSSALFTSGQESLEEAQRAKYASLIDEMGVKEGDHVLEIGCGWGASRNMPQASAGSGSPGSRFPKSSSNSPQSGSGQRACRIVSNSNCRTIAMSAASMTASPPSRCSRRWGRNTGRSISTSCANA